EALELGWEAYVELQRTACELGLDFFATAFDFSSADFLNKLGVSSFKIASGDVKNIPLLTHVARFQKPVIMSTGGATLDDIRRAYDAMMPINRRLCILQCTAAYPVEAEELNLRVITTLRDAFPNVTVGLSDHFNGISMAVAAYVLGARVVEKHFTLNHTWKGTDHAFSLEPVGMRKLVRDLRRTKVALGTGLKCPLPSERDPLLKMSKKLVASRNLPVGHVLSAEDVAMKSPGDGLPPHLIDQVLGKTLTRRLQADDDITFDTLAQGEAG